MEENSNNNRRDNATKAILSRISNDSRLVEEVRQLLAENLQLRSNSNNDSGNNNDNTTVANSTKDGGVTSVEPAHASSLSSNHVVESKVEQKLPILSSDTPLQPTPHKHPNEEELAFTIDKDSETYGNIMSMAKWYRDSFFISANYANDKQQLRTKELEEAALRRKELQEQQKKKKNRRIGSNTNTLRRYRPQIGSIIPTTDNNPPPLSSPLAMGHPLLLSIGENYIKSTYAVDLLRPYATWIASKNGPLMTTASQSLAQTIPLGQASCNWAARENLLWLLQDQEWRDFAKSITTRYINLDDANVVDDDDGL
mmetsp:Transcript_6052/g.9896  ORF Transcript_6052/g.9896 Transcript_6052/m.9896 type:complete len:312 (-) Transcript_6052:58-993(-)